MAAYTGPVVDVDVHNRPKSVWEIIDYLPSFARELVTADPHSSPVLDPPNVLASPVLNNAARRADTFGDDGYFPGSSYEMLRDKLLDPCNYFRAVLTHDIGEYALLSNPELSAAVCTAANNWTIDYWLARDERLRGLIVSPMATPDEAAAEIRRVGGHPQMDGVLLVGSPLGKPFGHPVYHKIYEAAVEMGLVLSIHQAAAERPKVTARTTPSPMMTTSETISLQTQQAQHFVSSFIVNGVFEKYPDLRIIIKEYGVAWIPSMLWRMDQYYDSFRLESTWVKKWPSEYVRDHIKFSTQPIEVGRTPREVPDFFAAVDGMEDLLCYSSDYPHISFDDPSYVARMLPKSWTSKVLCDNACEWYGWTPPTAPAAGRNATPVAAAG